MTFEQWAENQNFYKGDTTDSFKHLWDLLIDANFYSAEAASDYLDELVGGEYGE